MKPRLKKVRFVDGSYEPGFHVMLGEYSYGVYTPGFIESDVVSFFERHLFYSKDEMKRYNTYWKYESGRREETYEMYKYYFRQAVLFALCLKLWKEHKLTIENETT